MKNEYVGLTGTYDNFYIQSDHEKLAFRNREDYPLSKVISLLKRYGNACLTMKRYNKYAGDIFKYAQSINGTINLRQLQNCYIVEVKQNAKGKI